VAELLELRGEDRVLDVAAGLGASARHLARTIGCRVEGLDLSATNLSRARRGSVEAGLDGTIRLVAGDAEALPFRDRVFDAVLSECAFSTFPDKAQAAREIFRVLRPGGRLGLSDVTVESGALPDELQGILLQAACLADARTQEDYRGMFQGAGFDTFFIEEHSQALSNLLEQVRTRLGLARPASLAGLLPVGFRDLDAVDHIVDQIDGLVRKGSVGYIVLVARRPDEI
jgi:ubiquinone/menaquinone biosynthesis C-methylase UbiE